MDFRPLVKNHAKLAREIGCNRTYLSLVLAGKPRKNTGKVVRPRPEMAKRIEAATQGVVRAVVLLGLEPHPSEHQLPPLDKAV